MSDLLRITGMVTGLNTEDMIKQLLKVEQIKVDRVKQKRETVEWKQDAYREISNLIRGLKDEYFNYAKSDKNIRTASNFNTYKALYNGADSSNYLSVIATKDSTLLNSPITDIQMATVAKVTGSSLAKPIEGLDITNFDINLADDNTKITVSFNGVSKVIDITPMNDATKDITDLVNDLQSKINTVFGTGKIVVGNNSNKLTFSTDSTNRLSIGYAYNAGARVLFGNQFTSLTVDAQNNKFKLAVTEEDGTTVTKSFALTQGANIGMDQIISEIQAKIDAAPADGGFGTGVAGSSNIRVYNEGGTIAVKTVDLTGTATGPLASAPIASTTLVVAGSNDEIKVNIGGTEKTIKLAAGSYSKNRLLEAIQSKLDDQFGEGDVIVNLDGTGNLRFERVDQDRSAEVLPEEDRGLEAIGLEGPLVSRSNKIDLKAKLADIMGSFNTGLTPADSADTDTFDIEFTINGESFAFNSATTSLQDVFNEVNYNTNANVVMKYDELSDSIIVESKDTGNLSKVEISDVSGDGNLMQVLGLHNATDTGSDAVVTFNGGTPSAFTVVRSTNNFIYDGVTFDLKQNLTGGNIQMSLTSDTDKTFDLIKGFVEKYNEVISKVYGKVTEKRNRDYVPLTDEQRKDMSEKEIELWETQAKKGLLRSDQTLQNFINDMRGTLYQKVDGVRLSLFDIGISTTSDYLDGGKLKIDEDKLKKALKENPQDVVQLFTKTGETAAEKGISNRLFDIMEKNIRTTRDASGRKGILLEKAGIEGDISEYQNELSEQIDDYDKSISELLIKLSDKEDKYYAMFARMESAIAQMNNQSAWLSSQFGAGGS